MDNLIDITPHLNVKHNINAILRQHPELIPAKEGYEAALLRSKPTTFNRLVGVYNYLLALVPKAVHKPAEKNP